MRMRATGMARPPPRHRGHRTVVTSLCRRDAAGPRYWASAIVLMDKFRYVPIRSHILCARRREYAARLKGRDDGMVAETKEALRPEMVQAFVGVAHGDLERVKELLEGEPALVNAAWDWGGGDWETALGAAAHMGRADIARYLLDRGARIDLFAAAMLGDLGIVKAVLTVYPGARHLRGPHGIALIDHARAGGEAAAEVVAYLETPGEQ